MMNKDLKKLKQLILRNEEELMASILNYAKIYGYAKYTSTLKEAWRLSIAGLSEALVKVIDSNDSIPKMTPETDFMKTHIAEFGITEARKHRSRGVTLGMFLSFMKYYFQSYVDLLREAELSQGEKEFFCDYIKQFFDYIEMGFTLEWTGLSDRSALEELQNSNREMTNEKNKYLTIFESIFDPVILYSPENKIENMNSAALSMFFGINIPGGQYYNISNNKKDLDWLTDDVEAFSAGFQNDMRHEKTVMTCKGEKIFSIKYQRMLDISEKYIGTVIIMNDITDRVEIEKQLIMQQKQLEHYAFTDAMTGVSNRRTGYMIFEKQLSLLPEREIPLCICYLDIDDLKEVNDKYGHIKGDEMIKTIVHAIESNSRESDHIVRMGGDEFLIIMPACFESEAQAIIQRILLDLVEYDKKNQIPYKHIFSFGIVQISKENILSISEAIKKADAHMYQNKILHRKIKRGE